MKIHHHLFLPLALLGCGISYGAITTTTITDFTDLYNGTAVEGITLPSKNNATLTSSGGISLSSGYLGISLANAANTPSVAGTGFSIAMTFASGSLGNPATLFSTTYVGKDKDFNGLFGAQYTGGAISLGYWGQSQTNSSFANGSTIDVSGASGDISVVWSQAPETSLISLSVYDGSSLIGTVTSTAGLSFSGSTIDVLSVGGKGTTNPGSLTDAYPTTSDLELKGLQTMVGGTMDETAFQSYYAQLVPEPATATLGLLGLASLLMRRRRV